MKLRLHTLLFALFIGGIFNYAKAQTEIDIDANSKTYNEIFDSLSTGLIQSRIPYGVLYDRVYGWSGLENWQSGDTTSLSRLFQTWYDLEQSYTDSTQRPNNYSSMRTKVQQKIYAVNIPIIVLFYNFSLIDTLAFTDGRMTLNNGMIIDNNNTSPYFAKQICMAGFRVDKIIANKNYTLQLDNALQLINSGSNVLQPPNNYRLNPIQSITVNNLTTGLQYIVTASNPQLIQFTQAGSNIIQFTVTTITGASFIAHQYITIENIDYSDGTAQRPNGPTCLPSNEIIESTIPFQGYGETTATNSFADYHIYYHTINLNGTDNCQRILKKPIIIMDGFDPQDNNKYYNIYEDYLSYGTNPSIKLGDELRDKGYDVIILNFPKLGSIIDGVNGVPSINVPNNVKVNGTTTTVNKFERDGGTDYMERNAFILEKTYTRCK